MKQESYIRHNVPEFSVSDLALSLKRTLEENYGRVRVRGELSSIAIPSSGHMYTKLKDQNALIDAVCWKGTLSKLTVRPEEGLEVICTGRITTYPARSSYQLIIESMELAGEGALLKMLEERKKKLAAEGLFNAERKQQIPFLPNIIGVVTSPTGAVIRDILHRLNDRFPRHVLLWPVMVQGEGAENQIAAAIKGFNALPAPMRPDVLIVARGGGSLEDLMPFNAENVVRATAESTIPIISAIGHETDTTLIDYAADLRAPTPTGAAEMAVPVRINLLEQVLEAETRLVSSTARCLSENRHRLEALSAKLGNPASLMEIRTQRVDHAGDKLMRVFQDALLRKEKRLLTQTVREPSSIIKDKQRTFEHWGTQLDDAAKRYLVNTENNLHRLEQMLELLSFENVLARGYAVVRSAAGIPVTNPYSLETGECITLQFKQETRIEAVVKTRERQKS